MIKKVKNMQKRRFLEDGYTFSAFEMRNGVKDFRSLAVKKSPIVK